MTLLVACGLRREAKAIARAGAGAIAVPGGGDAARLERELDALAAGQGVTAIVSSGLAGALDPVLVPGDLVIDGDAVLAARFAAALPVLPIRGRIIGRDAMAPLPADKQRLRAETGAAAVDMESHVAARVAARHGLAFAAIRVISDAAGEGLPPAAQVGMRPDGGVALGAVLGALARRPGQLPALLRTGRDAGRAFRMLDTLWRAIGVPGA